MGEPAVTLLALANGDVNHREARAPDRAIALPIKATLTSVFAFAITIRCRGGLSLVLLANALTASVTTQARRDGVGADPGGKEVDREPRIGIEGA